MENNEPKTVRISLIDQLRGSAMVLMAVDHSMYFAGASPVAESYGGVISEMAPVPLILIGLVTNIASGTFFVLAGTSIALFEASRIRRGWSQAKITRFLFTRAAILLVLDAVVEPFAWNGPVTVDTLSGLAFCIMVLAFVRRLAPKTILWMSLVSFVAYPLLITYIHPDPATPFGFVMTILLEFHKHSPPLVEFPLLGRLSLVLFGNYFGVMLIQKRVAISNSLLWAAAAGLALTLFLRLEGGFGNFFPYRQGSPWILFFIENKQPPSVVFLLFNFSLAILLLVALLNLKGILDRTGVGPMLQLFGQTALFFFVAHLLIYSKLISHISELHWFHKTWELVLVEFSSGLLLMIPICAGYRVLKRKYPSVLQYL